MKPLIETEIRGPALFVRTPVKAEASRAWRWLGGEWSTEDDAWRFDVDRLDAVREVMRQHFGHDDRITGTVDVRLRFTGEIRDDWRLWFGGRAIVSRRIFDRPVRLGRGVALAAGAFTRIAGRHDGPVIGNVASVVLDLTAIPEGHRDLNVNHTHNSIVDIQFMS